MVKPVCQVIRFDHTLMTDLTPSGRECTYYCTYQCAIYATDCQAVCVGVVCPNFANCAYECGAGGD